VGQEFLEGGGEIWHPLHDSEEIEGVDGRDWFADIQEYVLKLLWGPWLRNKRLKQVGLFEMVNMLEGVEGLSLLRWRKPSS
jgi:hypothetical protein